jgi:hypothetical protein
MSTVRDLDLVSRAKGSAETIHPSSFISYSLPRLIGNDRSSERAIRLVWELGESPTIGPRIMISAV